jgi:hypothetical protein
MVLIELYSGLDCVFDAVTGHSKAPCSEFEGRRDRCCNLADQPLVTHTHLPVTTTMTAPLRFLTLACTHTLPCRRLLFHSQFIAPNTYSSPFPSSLSNKSISRRAFVSTQHHRAAPAPTPPTTLAVLRHSPTVEDIEAAELDVVLPPQSDARLALTERAAEVCCNITCVR